MIVSADGKVQYANSAFLKRYPVLRGMIDDHPHFADVSKAILPSIANPNEICWPTG